MNKTTFHILNHFIKIFYIPVKIPATRIKIRAGVDSTMWLPPQVRLRNEDTVSGTESGL